MKPFWRAYQPWFAARGFHLYKYYSESSDGDSSYAFPPPTKCPPALPYAVYGHGVEAPRRRIPMPVSPMPVLVNRHSLQLLYTQPKFAPGRDSHMRDVIIKIVKRGSEEFHVYEELLHCSELWGPDFHGVLPTVAILDSPYDFSFVVMPRCALSSMRFSSYAHMA